MFGLLRLLLILGVPFVWQACLITEFENPPNSSSSNAPIPAFPPSDSLSPTDWALPDSLKDCCELKQDPQTPNGFHGISMATPYAFTQNLELPHWNDSFTVVLYFKAPGLPCLNALNQLKALSTEFQGMPSGHSVHFLAIATASSTESAIDYYLGSSQVNFPVFIDKAWEFSDLYGTGYVPVIMVFDLYGHAWQINAYPDRIMNLRSLLLWLLATMPPSLQNLQSQA